MQANHFLEFSSSVDYTCVWSSHIAIQIKGEDFRNVHKSILNLHDKSFTNNLQQFDLNLTRVRKYDDEMPHSKYRRLKK